MAGSTKQTQALENAEKISGDKTTKQTSDKVISIPQLMMNKGLPTDIAFVANYIDLGSPNMTDTVNAVLEPLAVSIKNFSVLLLKFF